MIIFSKKIPIYFGKLVIIVNNDFSESIKSLNMKNRDSDDEWKDCCGLSIVGKDQFNKTKYVILLDEIPTHSIIAHEALHITHYILRNICADSDIHNDETTCYLLDWIVEQVYTGLKRNNIEVRLKQP